MNLIEEIFNKIAIGFGLIVNIVASILCNLFDIFYIFCFVLATVILFIGIIGLVRNNPIMSLLFILAYSILYTFAKAKLN